MGLHFGAGELRHEFAACVEHAGHIGDQHEAVGFKRPGHGAGRGVGIDVEGRAVFGHGHGRDDRHVAGVQGQGKQSGIDPADVAHQAVINGDLLGHKAGAVFAGKAHGPRPVLFEQADHFLVDCAGEDHFHHLHGGGVGDAQAVFKYAFDVQALKHAADHGPAAVHNDDAFAGPHKPGHVLREAHVESGVFHGVAAVFDDKDFRFGHGLHPQSKGLPGDSGYSPDEDSLLH